MAIKAGATSETRNLYIVDTSGDPLTGIVFNSAGLTAYYARPGAAAVSITLATLAAVDSAWSSGGFKEIDSTNMPGWYRFDIPNAAIAAGAEDVSFMLQGATSMAPLPFKIELVAYDPQDAADLGLSAVDATNTRVLLALPAAETGEFGGIADANTLSAFGTNVSTILNRIGAFTGSGVNTILGFFRALMRSDATIPSDVGGTYAATDSTQAIKAAIPSAAAVADAVWDEATSGHQTAGTTGKALTDAASGGGGGGSTYAVKSIKTTLSGTENDYLQFAPGDTDDVVIFFMDTSNTPVTIPSITSVSLIDATGASVGTATLGTEHLPSGYVPVSVVIPSSGNQPVRLKILFSGPITKNIPVKVVS